MKPVQKGDVVKLRPEYRDKGDEGITFIATENEDRGRVRVMAQLGLSVNPTYVVTVSMLQEVDNAKGP